MKKRIFTQAIAVLTALSMLCSTALAASFDDLQNAIDGNTDAGEFIGTNGDDHYGYGKNDDGTFGVESWTTTTENEDGTTTSTNNVQLKEDVEQEEGEAGITIGGGQDVSLDLNGSDITGNGTSTIITVEQGGSLTLDDTSVETEDGSAGTPDTDAAESESGKITGGAGEANYGQNTAGGVLVNGGEFTMNGGEISGNTVNNTNDVWSENTAGGVVVGSGGSFTMNGGEISDNSNSAYFGAGGVFVQDASEFIMNDGELSGNEGPSLGSGGGVSVNGGSEFTMNDGEISDNTAYNGGGVSVNGGSFTMNDGEISGNEAVNEGGGVRVENGTFNMEDGEISDNTSSFDGGGVRVTNNGTFHMNGGEISGNKLTHATNVQGGAGVSVNSSNGSAKFEMTGGTISGHDAAGKNGGGVYVGKGDTFNMGGDAKIENNTAAEGAGVYVDKGGVFNMSGDAVIDNNTATERGGGILSYGTFNMDGGTVSNNTAQNREGGGIVIYEGEGTISKGVIKGNKTETKDDLGGGGIYVSEEGKLTITNVLIRSNTAATMGGGLAACIRGRTLVYATDGAAIFGNTAKGDTTYRVNDGLEYPADGRNLWETYEKLPEFLKAAQDVFTAGFAYSETSGGSIFGNVMLGYDQTILDQDGNAVDLTPEQLAEVSKHLANWEGYRVMSGDGSEHILIPVGAGNNGTVFGDRFLVLTAKPSEEAKKAAEDKALVIIEGNESLFTHGGGIANNGLLIIGKQTDGVSTAPDTDLEKNFVDQDGGEAELKENQFSFNLQGGLQDEATGEIAVENRQTLQVSNDASGKAVFDFAPDTFTKPGTYVFYVTEENDGAEGVTYDGTRYKITIEVKEETVTGSIGNMPHAVKTLVISDPVIEKTAAGEEQWVPADGISFTNKYEKPESLFNIF